MALVAEDVEFIAVSFVRGADIEAVRDITVGSDAMLVAKIETPDAIVHLDAIVHAARTVMVARGDLGVHMCPSRTCRTCKRRSSAPGSVWTSGHHGHADARIDDLLAGADACRGDRRRQRRFGRN